VTKQRGDNQSSQVDLLPKSEIFDCIAIHCGAEGVTFVGGSGGMLPQKILKNCMSLRRVFLYSERKSDPSKVTI